MKTIILLSFINLLALPNNLETIDQKKIDPHEKIYIHIEYLSVSQPVTTPYLSPSKRQELYKGVETVFQLIKEKIHSKYEVVLHPKSYWFIDKKRVRYYNSFDLVIPLKEGKSLRSEKKEKYLNEMTVVNQDLKNGAILVNIKIKSIYAPIKTIVNQFGSLETVKTGIANNPYEDSTFKLTISHGTKTMRSNWSNIEVLARDWKSVINELPMLNLQ